MKQKNLKLSCGANIEIYQDLLTMSQRQYFHRFALLSSYQFGRASSLSTSFKPGSFFSCFFTEEDDKNFGLSEVSSIKEIVGDYTSKVSWINATLPGCWFYPHTDLPSKEDENTERKISLLYNINTSWDTSHGGEMLFYNSYGEKEIAIDFVPGQLIFFDSKLLHKPAITAGHYEPRYIYVCQYVLA